jgi:hypothetical protein
MATVTGFGLMFAGLVLNNTTVNVVGFIIAVNRDAITNVATAERRLDGIVSLALVGVAIATVFTLRAEHLAWYLIFPIVLAALILLSFVEGSLTKAIKDLFADDRRR